MEASISDQLAAYGITHDGTAGGDHYLRWNGESIGRAHAAQAVTLLRMLDRLTGKAQPEGQSQ